MKNFIREHLLNLRSSACYYKENRTQIFADDADKH